MGQRYGFNLALGGKREKFVPLDDRDGDARQKRRLCIYGGKHLNSISQSNTQ